MLHVCIAQILDILIVELGGNQLGRSGIAYVWSFWFIFLNVHTSGMCNSYKNKKLQIKTQERLWGPNRKALSGWKIAKDKRAKVQVNEQINSQVEVLESPKKIQE